ncbi:MAG: biopolymer transporter ExbD [Candidatus Omnitrophica bacterium]|nr:biopolymer transporter ExbD [Candidatus Omnitrophota bacterium]
MKLRKQLTPQRTKFINIDIAPLIDVVFQLLIFFMLTSSFIFQPGIRVNLPRAITSEALSERNVVIAITAENLIYIDEKLVTLNELISNLKRIADSGRAILIKADEKASLGRVVKIWDICRQEGISKVNIATSQTGD